MAKAFETQEDHAPRKSTLRTGYICTPNFDTEHDRAKVPPRNGNDHRPSLAVQKDAGGASEVRRGTSSINFHCPAPRSSRHLGRG